MSWNRKGAPGPSVFMPMLESEPHLHFEMTKLVISKSVKYITSKKPLVFYSINISPTDLSRTDFVKYFCGITSDCSWVRELIIFEVTEGERLTLDNQALDNINQLKSLGCKLAIDDFGSGYANFELLTGDLFSIVKLDKKFLSDSSLLNIGYHVIKALTRIVEDKDMKLVIEGIDNMDKIKYLKPNYRIYYQGFALGGGKFV
ncbi:EAL domain-containing protein [Vibrio rotiferianus]|uniref:EAL domain-containing protein n=1 Tax=Vibrio rotiferianus TaxID=190895 RepID=UPI0023EF540F|nr:EAL domain-containing protein [Vibrio rotiferianus]